MKSTQHASLLPYNTFGIDVSADYFIEYDSIADLQTILKKEAIRLNRILPVGAGSNLLFLKDFNGIVLHSVIKSVEKVSEDADSVFLKVGSGVVWDDLVAYCVDNAWGGVENLSLIPGDVGASAVQNIGAYGMEVQDVIVEVNTVEIGSAAVRTFSNKDCRYGYRNSIFKNELKGKYIITSVLF
ncbi:MAG: FAD-binding protein, partial [Bacteroidota bacterium]|nr:FAD-binding protein [Bacteroidota bacterium]